MTEELQQKLRCDQFTLGMLLLLVVVVSLPLGAVAMLLERTRQQQKGLDSFPHSRPVAEWRFGYVVGLQFGSTETPRRDGPTKDDIAHLERFARLHTLCCCGITDDALSQLEAIRTVKDLTLHGDQITELGLESLKSLTNLDELVLWDDVVSEDGVKRIRKGLPNCTIQEYWQCRIFRRAYKPQPPTNPNTP